MRSIPLKIDLFRSLKKSNKQLPRRAALRHAPPRNYYVYNMGNIQICVVFNIHILINHNDISLISLQLTLALLRDSFITWVVF